MEYHKLLEKQVKKFFNADQLRDEGLQRFLEVVSNSYVTFQRDKKLSEHAFAVSEKEYQEINIHLKRQNIIRHQSIIKLKEAIHSLDNNSVTQPGEEDDDLISVISYLENQIQQSKELETALISAKEIAEKAARAKSDFLSVMSHEIRTPLNGIIGISHLLTQDEYLPSQEENLRILRISADNLFNLINDILDFSKIEEGKIIFSERNVDIRGLVANIKMANNIRADEKNNRIRVMIDEELPAFVKTDDVRLGQVLNNLVSNAVKFTRNGNITIEVLLQETREESIDIYFSVTDTGIGIDVSKIQLIFERFTQANSEITREFGGSGLGLAIIKKLLTLQNSDIHVESEPGKGSTFYFTLRCKKTDADVQQEKKLNGFKGDLSGISILLVEDVEFNVQVAQRMLRNWNAKIQVAENGSAAVEAMKKGGYDIVLMDLQMPVMDGYTATSYIRTFDTVTPIIALTASASIDIQQKAIEHGMTGYLSKPFHPNELYSTIHKHTNVDQVNN